MLVEGEQLQPAQSGQRVHIWQGSEALELQLL